MISIYRILQHKILSKQLYLFHFDGSRESFETILNFVLNNEKMKKTRLYHTICRILEHYIDHYTDYNFAAISCIVLYNVIGLVNVRRLKRPLVLHTGNIQRLYTSYQWEPDYNGMCVFINCEPLVRNVFDDSSVSTHSDLLYRRAAFIGGGLLISLLFATWAFHRFHRKNFLLN